MQPLQHTGNLQISTSTSDPAKFLSFIICFINPCTWWRHQMETFSALLALCAGDSPVTGEFPSQRPVTRSFDFSFDLRLNKRLSKPSWGWWFESPSGSLWRHCNVSRLRSSMGVALRPKDHTHSTTKNIVMAVIIGTCDCRNFGCETNVSAVRPIFIPSSCGPCRGTLICECHAVMV